MTDPHATGGPDAVERLRPRAGRAEAGVNRDITELAGFTPPLSPLRGGTGGQRVGGTRADLGLPPVPGDPPVARGMEVL